MQNTLDQKEFISALAEKHSFLASGFARAEKLHETESQLTDWLEKGFHGKMAYMENHFQKRLNPSLLVEGAKTVICFAYNYFPKAQELELTEGLEHPQIAKYAWGDDYHQVIKEKLFVLMGEIQARIPDFEGRAFVDSAPVMERQWAERAGLGWIGKNSLLLRKGVGSFFFLAEIICNLELEPDQQQTDHCGECTACIDACPTQAIVQPQVIDSNRCISYLTIEDKTWPKSDEITKTGTESWAYGCDICQDVCPWNRFSQPNQEPRFAPREMIGWNNSQWKEALTEPARIKSQLKKSAMQRAGLKKLIAQIDLALKYRPE
ncbi:MAG: tRNA epoxyqueuosine(34) reductase QueG [Bacteroidetes bacterium]|nr:tRNA epoxyqueuosine(34) reductase QueG [Bacteroidota bacterium]MDA1224889.1 tRNA epoxyqueuosine(34) reductase QueG [Bacteroidota bacterium]